MPISNASPTVDVAGNIHWMSEATDRPDRTRSVALGTDLAAMHPDIAAIRQTNESSDGFLLHIFLAEVAFWLADSARVSESLMQAG